MRATGATSVEIFFRLFYIDPSGYKFAPIQTETARNRGENGDTAGNQSAKFLSRLAVFRRCQSHPGVFRSVSFRPIDRES